MRRDLKIKQTFFYETRKLKRRKIRCIGKKSNGSLTGGRIQGKPSYQKGDISRGPLGWSDKLYYNDKNQQTCAEVPDKAGNVIWYIEYNN